MDGPVHRDGKATVASVVSNERSEAGRPRCAGRLVEEEKACATEPSTVSSCPKRKCHSTERSKDLVFCHLLVRWPSAVWIA